MTDLAMRPLRYRRAKLAALIAVMAASVLATLPATRAEAVVQPVFGGPVNFPVGDGPFKATVANLDTDGDPDIVTANFTGSNVSVLLGQAGGTFGAPTPIVVGTQPSSVITADLDADGDRDLAVANSGSDNVSVLLNDGNGGFVLSANYAVESMPWSVTAAQINGDAHIDLVVANRGADNSVSVLLGSGTGTFAAATHFFGGAQPQSVEAADFNGDGKADLAVANTFTRRVHVMLGDGLGGFPSSTDHLVGRGPRSVAIADFDRDGDRDIASANFDSGDVSVLLGNGAGGFAAVTNFAAGFQPASVVVLDFNLDGSPDLATANNGGDGSVSVLAGNGTGTFGAPTSLTAGTGPSWVVSADFDGGGKPDLAVTNELSDNMTVRLNLTDTQPPTTTDDVPLIFQTTPVTVTLTATDMGGSAVSATHYEVGINPPDPTTASPVYMPLAKPVLTNGQRIKYFSTDTVGNVEAIKTSEPAKVDAVAPVTTDNVPASFRNAPVTVTLTATDPAGSGVDATHYEVGVSPPDPTTSSPVYSAAAKPVLANGQRIKYFSVDELGNTEAVKTSAVAQIETTAPVTTDNVPATAQTGPVTVTLTAIDTGGSGVDKTYYTTGASAPDPTTASPVYSAAAKPVLTDGQRIKYFSTDLAGNAEAAKTSPAARVPAVVTPPPPPPPAAVPPPGPPPPPPPPPGVIAKLPAKFEVARARVRDGKLNVSAAITAFATGNVRVAFAAAGRTTTFTVAINRGRISVNRSLPEALRKQTTGILTLTYGGSATVQRDSVRLRAAANTAQLKRTAAGIDAQGRLRVAGTIARGARGFVVVRLGYNAANSQPVFLNYRAKIAGAKWSINQLLPAAARKPNQLSMTYAGDRSARISGQQVSIPTTGLSR